MLLPESIERTMRCLSWAWVVKRIMSEGAGMTRVDGEEGGKRRNGDEIFIRLRKGIGDDSAAVVVGTGSVPMQ